jgi:hypothetical protein
MMHQTKPAMLPMQAGGPRASSWSDNVFARDKLIHLLLYMISLEIDVSYVLDLEFGRHVLSQPLTVARLLG